MTDSKKIYIHFPSFIVVMLAALFTFGIAVWPGIDIDRFDLFPKKWWIDVVLHGMYYFFLAIIIFPFFTGKKRKVYWFFPALFVLSLIFEFLQYYQDGRTVSVKDMVGNLIGIAFAALFSYWGRRMTWRARQERLRKEI